MAVYGKKEETHRALFLAHTKSYVPFILQYQEGVVKYSVELDKNFDEQILTHFNIKSEPNTDWTTYIPELYGILPDGTRIFPRNDFTSPEDILESYYIAWEFKGKEPIFKRKESFEKVFYRNTRKELNPYFRQVLKTTARAVKKRGDFLNKKELEIESGYKIFKRLECHKLMLLSNTNPPFDDAAYNLTKSEMCAIL